MRVALAQINLTVGDLDGNVARLTRVVEEAREAGAQVVAVPELAVTGYPPEDLVLKRSFVRANQEALEEVAGHTGDLLAVIGFVEAHDEVLHNSAALCTGGDIVAVYRKQLLPNYGVFDERRYFLPGLRHVLAESSAGVLGLCVCEDAWSERGPVISQGDAGAQVVVNINASPYHKGKLSERTEMLAARARRARASIVYVNMVGGQDELVFDGGSLVLDPDGELVARLPQFEERLEVVDVPLGATDSNDDPAIDRLSIQLRPARGPLPAPMVAGELRPEEEMYRALTLGVRDYVVKNGFDKVVIGLSGGIDSSLTATIATDALGPASVLSVAMPSDYSTSHSIDDAKALATNLGIEMLQIPIAGGFRAMLRSLEETFGAAEEGVAEENLQARIRGNLLMFISNRYGHLVLATGNKSEGAVGYATLYGDMAGGLAVIKDLFKTEVYALARWRNTLSQAIPENVLTKAPSAELRPEQKDEDSLPPYETLDRILEAYIEEDASAEDIIAQGCGPEMVDEVIAMVDRAEYKRRQAPPGLKVTTKSFGRDRRLPITNLWRETGRRHPPIEPADGPDR